METLEFHIITLGLQWHTTADGLLCSNVCVTCLLGHAQVRQYFSLFGEIVDVVRSLGANGHAGWARLSIA